MKTLKLDHELALQVLAGTKTSTWRLFDDKDLSVGDDIEFIDKVDPQRPTSWRVIGTGKINTVIQKPLGDIQSEDMVGHEKFATTDEMIAIYRRYYGNAVTITTDLKIIHFTFTPT